MVSDTDGSAFITKAEFDSLKNNFQSQIDNYNSSIDSKIDGAIAAYLAGIKLSSVQDCNNLLNTITNGGHSGLNITFGKNLGYMNTIGILEGSQSYVAVGALTSSGNNKSQIMASYLKGIQMLNTRYAYVLSTALDRIEGMVEPKMQWVGFNCLSGTSGMDWLQETVDNVYTWVNFETYVKPQGSPVSLEANGVASGGSKGKVSGSWGFTAGWMANIGKCETINTWDHTIDFETYESTTAEFCVYTPSTGKIKFTGTLAMPTDLTANEGYARNRSVWYDGYSNDAIENVAQKYVMGNYSSSATYGTNAWHDQTFVDQTTKGYKAVGIRLTSGAGTVVYKDLNSVEWPCLTSVVPTCKSPKYGIPIYKIPAKGHCTFKIKVDQACQIWLYCSPTANTTWTGGDSALPKNSTIAANTEKTYSFEANKDDILFIALQPTSTSTSIEYTKITSMSCQVEAEN